MSEVLLHKLRRKSPKDIEVLLSRWLPELAPRARSGARCHPMGRPEPSAWLDSLAKRKKDLKDNEIPNADNGDPAFIPAEKRESKEPRVDYVLGKSTRGYGYYHLLTKWAYQIFHERVTRMSRPTAAGCGCLGRRNPEDSKEREDFEMMRLIIYNRAVAESPNDSAVNAWSSTLEIHGDNVGFLLSSVAGGVAF